MRSDLGNRHRISADLFLKQAPKVQASRGGGAGGVLPLEVLLAATLSPSPSHSVREDPWVESDQFP